MTILNVFINGTDEPANLKELLKSHRIGFLTSLANLLDALIVTDSENISLCLDGCGVNNPYVRDLGGIFTWHLEAQVEELARSVKEQLKTQNITLNIYGFSRGGAAAFLLAKKLKDIHPDRLSINILAFEPVPGNFVRGVYLDQLFGLGLTLSSMIADLTDCANLKRVKCLYTNEPLPDIACHAPILPAFPNTCEHSVEVVPGCHKNAELFRYEFNPVASKMLFVPSNIQSAISFHLVLEFMTSCGAKFDLSKLSLHESLRVAAHLPDYYEEYVDQRTALAPTRRAMHFSNVLETDYKGKLFLNADEQRRQGKPSKLSECALTIQDPAPVPSYANGQKSAAHLTYPLLFVAAALYVFAKPTKTVNRLKVS